MVVLDGAGISWREARQVIEQYGGRVRIILVLTVLIGEVPEGAAIALERASTGAPGALANAPSGIRVVRTRAAAEALLPALKINPGAAQTPVSPVMVSPEVQGALRLLAPQPIPADQDSRYRVLPGGVIEVRPITEILSPLLPPLPPPQPESRDGFVANSIGRNFNSTSSFLAGDIGIAILRPESNGVADGFNTET